MNRKQISDALEHLDPAYIDEATAHAPIAILKSWHKWVAAVACLCVCVSAVLFTNVFHPNTPPVDSSITTTTQQTADTTLSSNSQTTATTVAIVTTTTEQVPATQPTLITTVTKNSKTLSQTTTTAVAQTTPIVKTTTTMRKGSIQVGISTTKKGTTITTAPTVDALKEALTLNEYPSGMQNMEVKWVGKGVFDSYLAIQKNPTTAGDLPMDITQKAHSLGNGVADFSRVVLNRHAFSFTDPSLVQTNDLSAALEAVFVTAGNTTRLQEAIAALANLNDDLVQPLAVFLQAAAQTYATYDRLYGNLPLGLFGDFTYAKVTDDDATLRQAYELSLTVDENEAIAAGNRMIRATEQLISAINTTKTLTKNGNALTVSTPIGQLIFGSSGVDTYNSPAALLLIDPDGNDIYNGKVAASTPHSLPISVVIDKRGNDVYTADSWVNGTQGCGILGCGLLFDLNGNDTYTATRTAQGFALHGTGVLYDQTGNDTYRSEVSSQAAAHHGYALLADMHGKDSYHAIGYSQAMAGNRAVALLVDGDGDDRYDIEAYVQEGYENMAYSPGKTAGNWSQGSGCGNRAIETDERGLAGGIAGLIDLSGNDNYNGGNWVQGTGYWSGIGFLSDMDGDDRLVASYYSQSSVAHYGAGVLLNVNGDDRYVNVGGDNEYGASASLCQVWDRGVSLFVDDGGNDVYTAAGRALGCADSAYDEKGQDKQDLTYAIFLDTHGDDYYLSPATLAFGWGWGGYFFDLGGNDNYTAGIDLSRRDDAMRGVFLDKATEDQYMMPFWESLIADYRTP